MRPFAAALARRTRRASSAVIVVVTGAPAQVEGARAGDLRLGDLLAPADLWPAAALRRRSHLCRHRRRAHARRPALSRRRRSQAAAHLPRLSGRLRRARSLRHARRASVGRAGGAADGGISLRHQTAGGRCPGGGRGLFLVFSTTWHDYDALAANCELFLLVPQTLAAWLLLRDLRARSAGVRGLAIHLAVGALIGASALFKYQGLTFLGASIGLLVWWVILGRASGRLGRDHGALVSWPAPWCRPRSISGGAGAPATWRPRSIGSSSISRTSAPA